MKCKIHLEEFFPADAAVLKDKRPVSEISDIDVMDEVIEGEGCKENQGEETMNLQEDEWQKVSTVPLVKWSLHSCSV